MAEEYIISDYLGRPIGRIIKDGDRSEVSDWTGKPLGSADENGTRDYLGKPLYQGNHPELLIPKEEN